MTSRPQRSAQQNGAPSRKSTPLDGVFRAVRPALVLLFGFSLFANVLKLTIPIYVLQVMDRVLSSANHDTLFYLTLVALGAICAAGVIGAVMRVLQNRIGSWIEWKMIEPVLGASLDGRLSDRSMGPQALRDLSQLRGFFTNAVLSSLFDLPWVLVFLLVIFLLHPVLGLVGLLFAVAMVVLALLNDLATRRAQERSTQESGQLTQSVGRGFQNSDSLHAMGIVPNFLRGALARSESARRSQDIAGERGSAIMSIMRTVRQGAQILILGIGAFLVIEGEATSGLMMAGSILLNLALSPLDQASNSLRSVINVREALARLRRQLGASDEGSQRGRAVVSKPRGHLTAQQAMFIPQGRKRPAIKPLTLSVAPGEMVGIIGPAAAGKSVLCRMLVGLLPPHSGAVQLDGVNLNEWVSAGVGRYVGYLAQDPDFFAGSVADNIGRLDPDTPERAVAVREAAELLEVQGAVLNLPQGYDSDFDMASPQLSRSELQKIGLARAFYGAPQLLVLDEPATFLDRSGEAALVAALSAAKERGATIIVVSQRPTLMRLCDRLVLLRDGSVEAHGEPDKVLEQLRSGDDGRAGRVLRIAK